MRWDWVYVRMNLEKRKMFFRMRQVSGRIESQIERGVMLLDGKTLQELKRVNIKEVNPDELVDISEIEIDTKQSVQKRVKEYVEQVHNPYLVRVGEYVVKIGYSDCKETLNDRMKQYISKIAETKY